jgi:hypothetical protein
MTAPVTYTSWISGNSRIALMLSTSVIGVSGSSGTALGQFQGAMNLAIGGRGIYVAETGNNRVQGFDPVGHAHGTSPTPFTTRLALSVQFSPPLSQPHAIAPIADPLSEKIYIADTANNRVIEITLPETSVPDTTAWNPMKTSLLAGNIDAAVAHFSGASAEDYRRSFIAIGPTALSAVMNKTLTPEVIRRDSAQYSFEEVIAGQTITFPVEFVKENGVWKILGF